MKRARFGRSVSKCWREQRPSHEVAATRSCWELKTTAGTVRLSRTRCTEARTRAVAVPYLGRRWTLVWARWHGPGRRGGLRSTSLSCSARAMALRTLSDAPLDVAALEAGVVVEADPGELGDLFAPQPRDSALAAEVADAGLCGGHVARGGRSRNSRMSSLLVTIPTVGRCLERVGGPDGTSHPTLVAGASDVGQRVSRTLVARRSSIAW